jgi:hypothetical protein
MLDYYIYDDDVDDNNNNNNNNNNNKQICRVNNTGKVNIFLDFIVRLSWLE